jgi:hypothetical protein
MDLIPVVLESEIIGLQRKSILEVKRSLDATKIIESSPKTSAECGAQHRFFDDTIRDAPNNARNSPKTARRTG